MEKQDLLKLFDKAYFFLKFRPRTEKELRKYLYRKILKTHWSQDDVDYVIQDLKEQQLINDKEFVRWFVEQRTILNPKSERLLKLELLRYGVEKPDIEQYFEQHTGNEEEAVERMLRRRWPRYRLLERHKRFEKAAAFLLRRGFSYETIKKAIEKVDNY